MSFEDIYERHHASLFRYLHRFTGDADLAADLTQDAFARLLRSRVPEDDARAWLFRVGGNLARDDHRARVRRARLLGKEAARGAIDGAEEATRAARIRRVRDALARLDERDRRMLLMREEGFSYSEIAAVVDVAPSSIGTLLVRALERFRGVIAEGMDT